MYAIETHFDVLDTTENQFSEAWENTFTETTNGTEKLLLFRTKHEAQSYLQEVIRDSEEAYELGYIDAPYDEHDLRITEV